MKFVDPGYLIETPMDPVSCLHYLELLERAGRTCYKSQHKIEPGSADAFVARLVRDLKHESVIEHGGATVRFICDRGVSHELVRHRLASFSQESTRYCNYSSENFGAAISFITPLVFPPNSVEWHLWVYACRTAEDVYFKLLKRGAKPQDARAVLPNSLKTEIVVTANWREWRHILRLRTSPKAHPEMRRLMQPLLEDLRWKLPPLFGDL
jgi:thymidylate synthase (FAD)